MIQALARVYKALVNIQLALNKIAVGMGNPVTILSLNYSGSGHQISPTYTVPAIGTIQVNIASGASTVVYIQGYLNGTMVVNGSCNSNTSPFNQTVQVKAGDTFYTDRWAAASVSTPTLTVTYYPSTLTTDIWA